MHEYSIVQSLMERVGAEAGRRGATSVASLRIALGELSGVDPELLASAYEVFRERTICAGAPLEIRAVPAVWECSSCGRPIARGEILQCPDCRSRARLASGDEIILERIEMEVADV
jgi:hydrogenase nickel incorporation protein HypA/HybF